MCRGSSLVAGAGGSRLVVWVHEAGGGSVIIGIGAWTDGFHQFGFWPSPSGSLLLSLCSSMFSDPMSLRNFFISHPILIDITMFLGQVLIIHGPYIGESIFTSNITVSSLHW